MSAAFTLISILGICKNRTYFVKVSRYINEHRKLALENNDVGFKNVSKMWHNPKYPKNLDKGSTQMICLYLLCGCYVLEVVLSAIALFYIPFVFNKNLLSLSFVVLTVFICGFSVWKSLKD